MNIIIGKRGYGKTTLLIKRAAAENLYILTTDQQRARHIAQLAKRIGCDIPYPVTVNEFFCSNKFAGTSIRRDGLLIDDADNVLQTIFNGIPIKDITITDNDKIGNCIRYMPKPN